MISRMTISLLNTSQGGKSYGQSRGVSRFFLVSGMALPLVGEESSVRA